MNVSTYGYTVLVAHLIGKEPYGAFSALMGALLVISVWLDPPRRRSRQADSTMALTRSSV